MKNIWEVLLPMWRPVRLALAVPLFAQAHASCAQFDWPFCIWYDPFLLNCVDGPGVNTSWCLGNHPLDPPAYNISSVFRPATYCDNTNYVLVFGDEFEGAGLDYSKWSSRNDGHTPYFAVNQHENVNVSNGELRLSAQKVSGVYEYLDLFQTPPEQSAWFEYTTSNIGSRYRFHEGLYEIRCYFEHADDDACDGTFPAFWMYGENNNPGCKGTEIDVFEYRGNDGNRWRMTHHTGTHCADHRECATCYEGGNPREYLTYRLYWERHAITWWRSDVGVKRILPRWKVLQTGQDIGCNSNEGYYLMLNDFPQARPIADHALNIILNVAIDSRDDVEHESSAFPVNMVVDWVRYYRRVPCMGDIVIATADGILSSFGEYNYLTGTAVTVQESFGLSAGQQLEIVATEHLDINPGITLETGSDFLGRIGASNCGQIAGLALQDSETMNEYVDRFGEMELPGEDSEPNESRSLGGHHSGKHIVAASEELVVPMRCKGETATMDLLNYLGQVVRSWSQPCVGGIPNLSIAGLGAGAYVLRIVSQGEGASVKVIIP